MLTDPDRKALRSLAESSHAAAALLGHVAKLASRLSYAFQDFADAVKDVTPPRKHSRRPRQ